MRRRLGTSLVAGAVAVLAVAAIVDALSRGAGGAQPPAAVEPSYAPAGLEDEAEELRAAGVRGTLYYLDARCRLAALRLPALARSDVTRLPTCHRARSRRPSELLRSCSQRGIDIFNRATPLLGERDCVVAAKPDGTLTRVRAGEVVEVLRYGDGRVLLSRHDVARAVGSARVIRAAWLSGSRVATILDGRKGEDLIAVFDGRRLVASVEWFPSQSARFFVSPRRTFFAVATERPDRLFLLDRDARPGALADVARNWFGRTSLSGARAIAWSPDERWTALAKGESIYVFTTDNRESRLVRLPITARDLDWR